MNIAPRAFLGLALIGSLMLILGVFAVSQMSNIRSATLMLATNTCGMRNLLNTDMLRVSTQINDVLARLVAFNTSQLNQTNDNACAQYQMDF